MRILPIANNQIQNSNQNFGSMQVPAELISDFQRISLKPTL